MKVSVRLLQQSNSREYPLPKTIQGIRDFFNKVNNATSRRTLFQAPEEEPFTEAQEQEQLLISLSRTREAQEGLFPFLEQRIEELDDLMPSLLHSHPEMCAIQGRKEEARDLLKQFKEWSKGE